MNSELGHLYSVTPKPLTLTLNPKPEILNADALELVSLQMYNKERDHRDNIRELNAMAKEKEDMIMKLVIARPLPRIRCRAHTFA